MEDRKFVGMFAERMATGDVVQITDLVTEKDGLLIERPYVSFVEENGITEGEVAVIEFFSEFSMLPGISEPDQCPKKL